MPTPYGSKSDCHHSWSPWNGGKYDRPVYGYVLEYRHCPRCGKLDSRSVRAQDEGEGTQEAEHAGDRAGHLRKRTKSG